LEVLSSGLTKESFRVCQTLYDEVASREGRGYISVAESLSLLQTALEAPELADLELSIDDEICRSL
ncbi:hypothetical protein KIPB_017097, partial [Kipferlia bialata]